MVVPGSIQLNSTRAGKRKARPRQDAASKRNAAQVKLEAEEAFDLLNHFVPQAGLPPAGPPSPPLEGFQFEPNDNDDDEQEDDHAGQRLGQYLRSRRYREKRARNIELWNGVLPDIFAEFMRLREKTMAWGHPDLWNHDWHQCDCTEGNIRFRDIDMVDILSKLFLHFFANISPKTHHYHICLFQTVISRQKFGSVDVNRTQSV